MAAGGPDHDDPGLHPAHPCRGGEHHVLPQTVSQGEGEEIRMNIPFNKIKYN